MVPAPTRLASDTLPHVGDPEGGKPRLAGAQEVAGAADRQVGLLQLARHVLAEADRLARGLLAYAVVIMSAIAFGSSSRPTISKVSAWRRSSGPPSPLMM